MQRLVFFFTKFYFLFFLAKKGHYHVLNRYKFSSFVTNNSLMKIFVAGLPYDLDDAELMEIFEKFGTTISAKVAMDKETGKSKGFGFVEMTDKTEALDAIESLNDMSLGKKPLVVKQAEERPPSPGGYRPGGNSGGGGFNRDNRGGGGYNDRNRN